MNVSLLLKKTVIFKSCFFHSTFSILHSQFNGTHHQEKNTLQNLSKASEIPHEVWS